MTVPGNDAMVCLWEEVIRGGKKYVLVSGYNESELVQAISQVSNDSFKKEHLQSGLPKDASDELKAEVNQILNRYPKMALHQFTTEDIVEVCRLYQSMTGSAHLGLLIRLGHIAGEAKTQQPFNVVIGVR